MEREVQSIPDWLDQNHGNNIDFKYIQELVYSWDKKNEESLNRIADLLNNENNWENLKDVIIWWWLEQAVKSLSYWRESSRWLPESTCYLLQLYWKLFNPNWIDTGKWLKQISIDWWAWPQTDYIIKSINEEKDAPKREEKERGTWLNNDLLNCRNNYEGEKEIFRRSLYENWKEGEVIDLCKRLSKSEKIDESLKLDVIKLLESEVSFLVSLSSKDTLTEKDLYILQLYWKLLWINNGNISIDWKHWNQTDMLMKYIKGETEIKLYENLSYVRDYIIDWLNGRGSINKILKAAKNLMSLWRKDLAINIYRQIQEIVNIRSVPREIKIKKLAEKLEKKYKI